MSDRAIQYLRSVLDLNPLDSADEIIRRRETAVGLRKPEARTSRQSDSAESPSMDESERRVVREKLKGRIEELRSKFWLINASQLRTQLDTIPLKKYPELRGAVERLKLMTVYKSEFEKLGKTKNLSINFWNTIKRIVIASPQQAGQIKDEYIRQLGSSSNLKKVQASVKTIRSKFPEIYQLESSWFDQIRKMKARGDGSGSPSFEFEIPSWAGWVFWILLLVLARALIRFMS